MLAALESTEKMAGWVHNQWRATRRWTRPASFHQEERDIMKNLLKRLWQEVDGQDLTEYALLLVLIALAAVSAIHGLATAISSTFVSITTNLSGQ